MAWFYMVLLCYGLFQLVLAYNTEMTTNLASTIRLNIYTGILVTSIALISLFIHTSNYQF